MSSESQLLRIGAFSRASSLSVKALRAYHESGLLVPAEIDPTTGYRSYSADQLIDAAVIARLRVLDVPLDSIGLVLEARDPEVTRKVLTEHGAVLEERIAAMQSAIDGLYLAVDAPAVHTPVHTRDEPARTVLAVEATITNDEFASFLARTAELLHDAAVRSGAVVQGCFGGCYATLVEDDAQDVLAFLPIVVAPLVPRSVRSAGVMVNELPAATVAVLAHRGGYGRLADSYRKLGAWVATNAQPVDLPVREYYVVGAHDTDDRHQYLTELCWPVRRSEVAS